MKNKIIVFNLTLALTLLVVMIINIHVFSRYKSSINEAALSMYIAEIESKHSTEEKEETVKRLLCFVDMPDDVKQILVDVANQKTSLTSETINKMRHFEYNNNNLQELCIEIKKSNLAIDVFKVAKNMISEELAIELINSVFGNATNFKIIQGDGSNFVKRYYCSNVCIDACENGVLKYISNFNDLKQTDPFINWMDNAEMKTIKKSKLSNIEYKEVESKGNKVKIYINHTNQHVIAAVITLKTS